MHASLCIMLEKELILREMKTEDEEAILEIDRPKVERLTSSFHHEHGANSARGVHSQVLYVDSMPSVRQQTGRVVATAPPHQ